MSFLVSSTAFFLSSGSGSNTPSFGVGNGEENLHKLADAALAYTPTSSQAGSPRVASTTPSHPGRKSSADGKKSITPKSSTVPSPRTSTQPSPRTDSRSRNRNAPTPTG